MHASTSGRDAVGGADTIAGTSNEWIGVTAERGELAAVLSGPADGAACRSAARHLHRRLPGCGQEVRR